MSRFWSTPLKTDTILKIGALVLTAVLVVLGGVWVFVFLSMKPPKERRLIENLQSNRVTYERLREMMFADKQMKAVYVKFGVETNSSGSPRQPLDVNFSVDRYHEYLTLLRQIGSDAAFRSNGNQPDLICIGAWGAGWAGSTRHVWACWVAREPANQVANLDTYYRNLGRSRDVYRHIDGNWYLRADW
jgi:hypothetical protein